MALKVVALISGGKDSLFSILHCTANGHEVVALANLYPPSRAGANDSEDIDSFMYQTIGHAIIPLYEQALGLPLFRQEITGRAIDQAKAYGTTRGAGTIDFDETEDLVPLLLRVKRAHPEVNAVSTGAIMSDYQRTRVESVALRLGFTPLSYLWQWPRLPPGTQASLLEDMAAVGQDSRIIKAASGGLDESFLWSNVAAPTTVARLTRASERFGAPDDGAILGEGGEYETLAVAGPKPLWKAYVQVNDTHRFVLPGEADSSSLRLHAPVLAEPPDDQGDSANLRIPALLDVNFTRVLSDLLTDDANDNLTAKIQPIRLFASTDDQNHIDTRETSYYALTGSGSDAATQTASIVDALLTHLPQNAQHASTASIVYTSIILQDMADFAAVNKVYGSYFTEPIPPARATIACASVMPSDAKVMLGVTICSEEALAYKDGLHVQSRSYWAPANIGPYSQATTLPCEDPSCSGNLVYVAGQIPLEPASMALRYDRLSDTRTRFAEQTVLSLQHMKRIGDVMKVAAWSAVLVFVATPPEEDPELLAALAVRAWTAYHRPVDQATDEDNEDEEFDVWHATQNRGQIPRPSQAMMSGRDATPLPLPPMWVVHVDALPRGAHIEWVGYGRTTRQQERMVIPHLDYLLRCFQQHIIWASD
ncbi:hypothetical protein LTR78_002532 [Recurvomyces mirabilis]|uniref:Diphthine--ammonia ligase n=1 Tax=Recurvomyces mirabilis TaxID=574656 RepID=A0AAE1C4C2_9PEZI|nr:hypothetical protein LTR78_002532 [Recurvomyces mirabilis]KAK5157461.1 hypothetical protein LTS14_004226 [Recurvomyces mirabilis]